VKTASAALDAGLADAFSFGRAFLGNPDLVEKFRTGAPLNYPPSGETWYRASVRPGESSAHGYTELETCDKLQQQAGVPWEEASTATPADEDEEDVSGRSAILEEAKGTRVFMTQKVEAKVFQFDRVLREGAVEELMDLIKACPEGYSAKKNTAMVPQAPWGTGERLPRAEGEAPPRPWFVPTPDGRGWIYHPSLYGSLRHDILTARRIDKATLATLEGYAPNSAGPIVRGELALTEPAVQPLVQHKDILASASQLHDGYGFVVPLGLFVNVTMPGCTSQMHTDAVEFRGVSTYVGTRKENPFPGWLTVCMQRSGLFKEYELHIATVVYYPLGDEQTSAGDLLLFADGPEQPATRHHATFNTAAICNNTKVWHVATHAARTEKAKTHAPPRSSAATLTWDAGRWVLQDEGANLAEYSTDDIRVSLQMKVGCFKDEADLARYRDHTDDMDLTVDEVFDILAEDLVKRGLLDPANPLPRSPTAEDPERYTLQDLCLDTYARPPAAEIVDYSYRC